MTAPRDRPILFSGPMVRALLAGRKTQTRRVVKPQPPVSAAGAGHITSSDPEANGLWWWLDSADIMDASLIGEDFRCPYGIPGDRLWVKETWGLNDYRYERGPIPKTRPDDLEEGGLTFYATEDDTEICQELRWRPSIHMPRWASRLTLAITDVRVERLRDISEADAQAEGLEWVTPGMWSVHRSLPIIGDDPRRVYWDLWDHINGGGAAAANPWVWAVSFEVVQP